MLAAQARGHDLFHYRPDDLSWIDGRLIAQARPVSVQKIAGAHFRFGEPVRLDLGSDVDVVWMRQDPPFDLSYITATHLLERIGAETLVVNDPAAVRNAPREAFRARLCAIYAANDHYAAVWPRRAPSWPNMARSSSNPFMATQGRRSFELAQTAQILRLWSNSFARHGLNPSWFRPFSRKSARGDKRIVLVDGEVTGAINRIPVKGEIRSNLAAGGAAAKTELTAQEQEICAALGPDLKARGLLFVGIDVIGGRWLTEINVTSPTGIVAIDAFNGSDSGAAIWRAVEGRVAGRAA